MTSNNILLTIAIPTYNRCEVLDKTILSIVSDPLFSKGEIELVVSDNCSDDNTPEVVKKYMEQYDNISYNRNSENIGPNANFILPLKLGKGEFLKLYNDYALFLDGTLSFLLQTVKENMEEKPVLFFPNGTIPHAGFVEKRCSSFDEFVDTATFFTTWSMAFGIWKDDFNQLPDIERSIGSLLWQTDVLLRLTAGKPAIVYNQILIKVQDLQTKGGYNLFKVFCDNYLSFYGEYLNRNILSKQVFRKEKRRLFLSFIVPSIKVYLIQKKYSFETDKWLKILFRHYKTYPIFYSKLVYVTAYMIAYRGWHVITKDKFKDSKLLLKIKKVLFPI